MNKIAFLFLTIDNLKHPNIWDMFFDKVDKKKYNIYVHPKNVNKVTNKLLTSSNLIKTPAETKHGYLVKGMKLLMDSALKDKDNKYFIFVSDSCIPIKKFDKVYDDITNKYKTNLVLEMRLKSFDIKVRYNKKLPRKCFKKFSQWSILTRNSVEIIVKSKYLPLFYNMNAGDEFILSILQCEDESFNYKSLPSTYVDWSISNNIPPLLKNINEKIYEIIDKYENIQEKDKKILLDIISQIKTERLLLETHPRAFEKINSNDIKLLKETPALFARKFSEKSNIKKYIDKIW
jgi:hypothetical protein